MRIAHFGCLPVASPIQQKADKINAMSIAAEK
jgi:hypothetical protein